MRGGQRFRSRWLSLVSASVVIAVIGCVAAPLVERAGASDSASVYQAASTFSGPFTVGHVIEPITAQPTATDMAQHDYVEQEFSAAGMAHAFRATSTPSNGEWSITPTSSAPYATRILVRRPANPKNFSGTVVVEWMNESDGESSPDWDYLNPEIMDAGDAWVGVSAQALGVNGGTSLLNTNNTAQGLSEQEPQRYGSLHHPGDQYSYDIYDQVAFGLRNSPSKVLGPLHPHHILAVGESQSAAFLTTFVDTLEPHDYPYDGIFIHSRGTAGPALDAAGVNPSAAQGPRLIRTDLRVPVFMSETQTDLILLGYAAAQQPNTNRIRTWEIAGTSHADVYMLGGNAGLIGCTKPINTGPQHEVVQAAFADFSRWVTAGTPPPEPAPFKMQSTNPPTLALDHHGNVMGGVRTPAVDVPTSTLTGTAQPGASTICSIFGSTIPFPPVELTSLYGSKANYLSKYAADLDKAISERYLLPSERTELLTQAQDVQFPAS